MRLLFAHDHRFVCDPGGLYYSDGQLPYFILQRYLKHFSEIVIVARVRPLKPNENFEALNLASGPGVKIVILPNLNNFLLSPINWIRAYKKLSAVIADCDAMLARTSTIAFLTYLLFRSNRKPWAVEVVGCVYDSFKNHGSLVGKWLAPVAAKCIKKMISEAPAVLYVTKRFLQTRYPTCGEAHSCSDVQLLPVHQATLDERHNRYSGPISRPVVGMIGSLVHNHKGIDTAIKAIALLHRVGVPAVLDILGAGNPAPWKKMAIDAGIERFVSFHGTLPSGPKVQEWLNGIDLYIQPSRLEGLPRALVEAMNQGCPAIASDVGGIPELLDSDYLHAAESYEKLAELMKIAIQTPKALLKMSIQNKKKSDDFLPDRLDLIRDDFIKRIRTQCEINSNVSSIIPSSL